MTTSPNPSPESYESVLSSLKSAMALIQTSALQQQASDPAQAPEARQARELGEALMQLGRVIQGAAQDRAEVRAAASRLADWLASLVKSGLVKSETSRQIELEPLAPLSRDLAANQPPKRPDVPPSARTSDSPPSESIIRPAASLQPAPAFRPVGPLQPVPLMIGGAKTTLNVRGSAQEVQAARSAAEQKDSEEDTSAYSGAWAAPPDIALIVARSRLKAEGCRSAIVRRQLAADHGGASLALKPADYDIIARAKMLQNCYVWALDPRMGLPTDEVLKDLAAAYDNLAAAAELADLVFRDEHSDHTLLSESYALLAEAQSALRMGLSETVLIRDHDQNDAFFWLRTRTAEDRVHVARYMKLEDPADPTAWANLAQRINELRSRFDGIKGLENERRRLLNKAKYHARRIGDQGQADARPDWQTLVAALDGLIRMGVPASDTDIREMLLVIAEVMPDDLELPASFDRIMQALDQYLMSRELTPQPELRFRPPSPEVVEVANLLDGGVVVLIGGECRPQSQLALERDLRLAELRWVSAAHHESLFNFEPAIARADVVLVMLAIRWSSHSFEGVKSLCEKHKKLFVRLPGGYNPNQVAKQIVDQVGDQLRATRKTASLSS